MRPQPWLRQRLRLQPRPMRGPSQAPSHAAGAEYVGTHQFASAAVVCAAHHGYGVVSLPRRGLTPGGTYVAGFALAWNSFVAFWTVSALASGGGLLFAAFCVFVLLALFLPRFFCGFGVVVGGLVYVAG